MLQALVIFTILSVTTSLAFSQDDYGNYIGTVKTEWMRGSESERRMVLLEDFVYVDPKGKKWIAPKGSKIDGATIPKELWTLIGGPYTGQYREASVIHDVYCETKSEPYRDVHRIFYYANRAAGVSEWKAKVLYGGVAIGGPKWGSKESKCFNCHDSGDTKIEKDLHGKVTAFPPITEDDVKSLADFVTGENPSLEQIDEYIQRRYPKSKFGH